jgi:hypothetical protein
MASLADILTTQKNGVVALSNTGLALTRAQGNATSQTVTADTLVIGKAGYLVNVCVVVAGSAAGSIYNASSVAGAAAGNKLFSIPATAGVYPLGQVFNAGLVISPGTGQSINVTYFVG